CGEPGSLAGIEGMEDQTRQHEVVCPHAVGREAFVRGVGVVDLRRDSKATRACPLAPPIEKLPDLGLYNEAARPWLLDDVPDRVEPYDTNPVRSQGAQPVRDHGARCGRAHVEVDLFRPGRSPE